MPMFEIKAQIMYEGWVPICAETPEAALEQFANGNFDGISGESEMVSWSPLSAVKPLLQLPKTGGGVQTQRASENYPPPPGELRSR